jgi:Na+/melibiose symporter-like transporter
VEEKSNSTVFLRPRFSLEIDRSQQDILSVLESELSYLKEKYKARISDHHVFIDICDKDSHFWSPHLHLEVLVKEKNSSTIKGLFSPKPQVWTLFMFLHFVVGISFLAFLTMLYVYSTLDKSILLPLMMSIFLPIIWISLYFVGRIGRDFGKKQMQELHDFLIESFPEN